METKEELVAFVKELLQQRPSRQMLKIYVIGSTLALLGAVAGLIEGVLSLAEELQTEQQERDRLRDRGTAQEAITALRTEEQETVLEETKGDALWEDNRRCSANRLHAS